MLWGGIAVLACGVGIAVALRRRDKVLRASAHEERRARQRLLREIHTCQRRGNHKSELRAAVHTYMRAIGGRRRMPEAAVNALVHKLGSHIVTELLR